jgi:hypothetical protein
MKKYLLIIILIVSAGSSFAQTNSPTTLSSGGGYATGSGFTNSFTVGQGSLVNTFSSGTFILTQGFQQPVDVNTGFAPVSEIENFGLFPNPSNGQVFLQYELTLASDVTIEVFDMLGQMVFSETSSRSAGHQDHVVNLDNQPAGIYFVRCTIRNAEGVTATTSKVTLAR